MYFILWFSFFLLYADVYLQTVTESKANDCPRFDYEYKLLERLLRIEFAQRESDANMEQLLEKLQSLQSEAREGIQYLKDKNIHVQSTTEQLHEKSKSLQTEAREGIQHLKDNKHGHGSTYIRWGRTVCSGNGTELVYKGFAGGSFYGHPGAAADFLCLTNEPILGKTVPENTASSFVYGAEYEIISESHPFSTVSREDDAPCCVCRTFRTSTIMIPGRTECYPGWTMEYNGYLMAGYYAITAATNYVCVDATPEARPGGSGDSNGHLLYVVVTRCGSLPCPPYAADRLVTCVICSK